MKVPELVEALEEEVKRVRRDVWSWGLDPDGCQRVLLALQRFEKDTAEDLGANLQYNGTLNIIPTLLARLENIRNLKLACTTAIAEARRCAWLDDWMATASPERGPGLALASKKPHHGLVQ